MKLYNVKKKKKVLVGKFILLKKNTNYECITEYKCQELKQSLILFNFYFVHFLG